MLQTANENLACQSENHQALLQKCAKLQAALAKAHSCVIHGNSAAAAMQDAQVHCSCASDQALMGQSRRDKKSCLLSLFAIGTKRLGA